MQQKIKSTSDKFIESLNSDELEKFQDEYKDFALSELILATLEQDEISAHKLIRIISDT